MNRKKIVIFVILSTVVLFFFFIIKSCNSDSDYIYEFEKISKGDVKETIAVTGVLELIDAMIFKSKVGGKINKVFVDFNDYVKKGQLLAVIDTKIINRKILKLKTVYEGKKLRMISALREFEGKKKMLADNLISSQALENSRIKYKATFYDFERIKLDYNDLLKEKKYTKIYSPLSGIIITKSINENDWIGANRSIFTIASSLKKMRLIISVDESDIGKIKEKQKVFFSVSAFPEKLFKGVIDQVRISPINSGGMVTYQSTVICNNNDLLLKPGMTATATIEISVKKNVLRVLNQSFIVTPYKDVTVEEGKKYLWKKKDFNIIGRVPAEKIEVVVGLVGDIYTEIIKKVKVNDEILVSISEK